MEPESFGKKNHVATKIVSCLLVASAVIVTADYYHRVKRSNVPVEAEMANKSHIEEEVLSNFAGKSTGDYIERRSPPIFHEILNMTAKELGLITPKIPKNVKAVMVVSSPPNEFEKRMEIRASWGNKYTIDDMKNGKIAIIFVSGTTNDTNVTHFKTDSDYNSDILQVPVQDTYRNLVYKLLAAFRWISLAYPNAHVVKIDTDAVIDTNKLLGVIAEKGIKKWLFGSVQAPTTPVRTPNSKYFVSASEFRGRFPSYCTGGLYVISAKALQSIIEKVQEFRVMEMEDVFFTGIMGAGIGTICRNERRILQYKPSVDCLSEPRDVLGYPCHNSLIGPVEELKHFMEMKEGPSCETLAIETNRNETIVTALNVTDLS